MREQLISYVDLLFAATDDAEEIKQEILQNTLKCRIYAENGHLQ